MAAREPAGAADSPGWELSLQFMFFEIKTEEEKKKKTTLRHYLCLFSKPRLVSRELGLCWQRWQPGRCRSALSSLDLESSWRFPSTSPVWRTREQEDQKARDWTRTAVPPAVSWAPGPCRRRAAEREEPEGPSRRRSQSLGFGAPPPAAGCRGSAPRAGLRPLVPLATRPPFELHMVTSPWGAGGGRLYKRVFPEGTPALPAAPNS